MAKMGRLTKDKMGFGMPSDAPLYQKPPVFYKNMEGITLLYETDEDAALALLPDGLELTARPTVMLSFLTFELSSFGPFKEATQCINCTWKGEPKFYVTHIFVDNDAAMAWGRELYGEPKKMASITFAKENDIIMGTAERPRGNRICTAVMRPERRMEPSQKKGRDGCALKIVPNPEPGGQPSLVQLVNIYADMPWSEMWEGTGSVQFNSTSMLDPWHTLPVKKMLKAVYGLCPYREESGRILKEY